MLILLTHICVTRPQWVNRVHSILCSILCSNSLSYHYLKPGVFLGWEYLISFFHLPNTHGYSKPTMQYLTVNIIHICHFSLQLGCSDTWQIWMWFNGSYRYYGYWETDEHFYEQNYSSPHPGPCQFNYYIWWNGWPGKPRVDRMPQWQLWWATLYEVNCLKLLPSVCTFCMTNLKGVEWLNFTEIERSNEIMASGQYHVSLVMTFHITVTS